MNVVVFFADYAIFGVFAVLPYLWIMNKKKTLYRASFSALVAWIVTKFIKDFFYFPRPFIVHRTVPSISFPLDGTFPSNHTAAAFAIASALYFHGHRRLGIFLLGLSTLIGVSRILGGVHFPLDILGGAAIGILSGKLLTPYQLPRHQSRKP